MAGSLGLNKRFEEAVKELVGEDQFYALRKTKGFTHAVEYFDLRVKTAFRGNEVEDYIVYFPMANLQDNISKNLVSDCWIMKWQKDLIFTHISRVKTDFHKAMT